MAKTLKATIASACIAFTTACQSSELMLPEFEPLEGYAPEDRVRIVHDHQWLTFGRSGTTDDKTCSPVLVAPDVIVLADHCTEGPDLKTREPGDYTFYIGFDDGDYVAKSRILAIHAPDTSINAPIIGNEGDVKFSSYDVAYMKLAEPLGDIYGYETIAPKRLDTLPPGNYYDGFQLGNGLVYGPFLTGDLSVEFNHHFIQEDRLVLEGEISYGDSGGALMIRRDWDGKPGQERYLYGIISQLTHGRSKVMASTIAGERIPDFK